MLHVLSLAFQIADIPCKLVTVNPDNEGGSELSGHLQHSHSGFEIHCVRSGELTVDCIGESFQLSTGQMLILPPGTYHYVRSVSAHTDRMDLLMEIGSGQNSRDAEAKVFLQALFRRQPILLEADTQPELFALLGKICRITMEYKDEFARREHLKALCIELVLLLGAAAKSCVEDPSQTAYEGTGMVKDRYIMDHFFNHNYHGNSDMEVLAKKLNMSVRQTGRVLQQTYGKGFREKMNECRLAVAVDLLRNTAKSMAEISEILGYSDPANFSSFVKRQTGKSPAQIRKEM